ncbi:MAG: IPT/TIG domain-containing protein [Acidobacteriia bacterium]|nr:IPT/TIG domain-containing protein [Terriglobia bacterium]
MFARSAAVLSLLLFVLLSPRFVWSQTPQITQISPAPGSAGTLVTITVSSFGTSQRTGSVSIGGAAATVGTWSDIRITATVDSGAPTGNGNVVVTTGGSAQSNAFAFTVLPPNVFAGPVTYSYDELGRLVGAVAATGDSVKYSYDAVGNILAITRYSASQFAFFTLSPKSGPVGTSVTISGSNFSSNTAQDAVAFNGTSATISSASATQLVVSVPSGATTNGVPLMFDVIPAVEHLMEAQLERVGDLCRSPCESQTEGTRFESTRF